MVGRITADCGPAAQESAEAPAVGSGGVEVEPDGGRGETNHPDSLWVAINHLARSSGSVKLPTQLRGEDHGMPEPAVEHGQHDGLVRATAAIFDHQPANDLRCEQRMVDRIDQRCGARHNVAQSGKQRTQLAGAPTAVHHYAHTWRHNPAHPRRITAQHDDGLCQSRAVLHRDSEGRFLAKGSERPGEGQAWRGTRRQQNGHNLRSSFLFDHGHRRATINHSMQVVQAQRPSGLLADSEPGEAGSLRGPLGESRHAGGKLSRRLVLPPDRAGCRIIPCKPSSSRCS